MTHKNWHQKATDRLSTGDRISDSVAKFVGSWAFVIIQTAILIIWVLVNTVALVTLIRILPLSNNTTALLTNFFLGLQWDKFPFIFMNLFMSMEAAYATPFILMSQNRQEARDKVQAEHQYEHQEQELEVNTQLTKEVHRLATEIHQMVRGKQS